MPGCGIGSEMVPAAGKRGEASSMTDAAIEHPDDRRGTDRVRADGAAETARRPAPVKRRRGSGSRRIYNKIREDILCLKLRPGEPLDEVSLGRRFKLSRSPVREALIRLAGEGLVNLLPNRSAVVAPLEVETLPRYLEALDLMQRITTRMAALLRSEQELVAIRAAQAAFEEACARCSIVDMIEANRDYHLAIAAAGRNPYFTSLYARMLDEGMRMLHIHFKFRAETQTLKPDLMFAEHTAMTEAIARQDAELAERLAHEHAEGFSDAFIRYMRQNLAADIDIASSTRRVLREVSQLQQQASDQKPTTEREP
jgi:DNA-binding GntR family transcriptional regulator